MALRRVREQLSGAATVGVGLVLLGVSAYAFLAMAGHALPPQDYTAVASLYFLTAIVGPGLFVAVEQETNRVTSSRIAAGHGTAGILRSAVLVSAGLAIVVAVVLLAAGMPLVDQVFQGSWALLLATVASVGGAAAVYVLRGSFAGERRFGWYSATLAAEGLARLVPCVVLVVVGVGGAATFGWVFALGAAVAALCCAIGLRSRVRVDRCGPAVDRAGMTRGVALLATASGLTLLVANLAPVVLTSRLPGDPATAAGFASLFVLARTPLFLFGPVQALLIPRLTEAAERHDPVALRRQLGVVLGLVAALGVAGTLVIGALGPWAARVFFAAPTDLSVLVAALLGLSTAAMMAAQVLQSALVALRRHHGATISWGIGAVLYLGLLLLPGDPVAAAVTAQLVAPLVVVALLAAATWRGLSSLRTGDVESDSTPR